MDTVILKTENVQAVFSPLQGMNLMQLQVRKKELIDQGTMPLFEERFAGLGSLIGPHFHRRPADQIMPVPSEDLFPHIARVKAKGVMEPFSHGIARYAPWKFHVVDNSLEAEISGDDLWNGSSLASLEGFSFHMNLVASLLPRGLFLDFSVESEKPSVIGLHYYYRLPVSGGKVKAAVEGREENLCFDALQEVDEGFIPKKGAEGFYEIFYENAEFILKISFKTDDPSWQLYRPKGSSYICIEPLSAKDPKHPIHNKSRLQVKIEVLDLE